MKSSDISIILLFYFMVKYSRSRKTHKSRFSRRSKLRKGYRTKAYKKKRISRKHRGGSKRKGMAKTIKSVINRMAETKN